MCVCVYACLSFLLHENTWERNSLFKVLSFTFSSSSIDWKEPSSPTLPAPISAFADNLFLKERSRCQGHCIHHSSAFTATRKSWEKQPNLGKGLQPGDKLT